MRLKKHAILMLSAIFMLSSAGYCGVSRVVNSVETPPAIEKGWNLISVPCGISIVDFKQKNSLNGLEAYSWNGAEYVKVETFERGQGYAINSNAVLNPSAECKGTVSEGYGKIRIKQGWNLIGNPFHVSVDAGDLFGEKASLISSIYQLYRFHIDMLQIRAVTER